MNRIMVLNGGCPALHSSGDIGREKDSYIRVSNEKNTTHYIGMFEEGLGFINVLFKKSDVRNITKDEFEFLNKSVYTINGCPICKVQVDEQGNIL